jgi:sulfur-carrier protein
MSAETDRAMKITIKLFATLRKGMFEEETREFTPGMAVKEVIRGLNIPGNQVTLILLNGRHAAPDTELHDGDTLSLFPPIGGG